MEGLFLNNESMIKHILIIKSKDLSIFIISYFVF